MTESAIWQSSRIVVLQVDYFIVKEYHFNDSIKVDIVATKKVDFSNLEGIIIEDSVIVERIKDLGCGLVVVTDFIRSIIIATVNYRFDQFD